MCLSSSASTRKEEKPHTAASGSRNGSETESLAKPMNGDWQRDGKRNPLRDSNLETWNFYDFTAFGKTNFWLERMDWSQRHLLPLMCVCSCICCALRTKIFILLTKHEHFGEVKKFWLVHTIALKTCLRVRVCFRAGVRIGFRLGSGWGLGSGALLQVSLANQRNG